MSRDSEELAYIRIINKFKRNHACEEFAEAGTCMHIRPKEIKLDDGYMLSAERAVVVRPGEHFTLPDWDGPYTYQDE